MNFTVVPDLSEKIHISGTSGGWSYPKFIQVKYANGTSAKYRYDEGSATKIAKDLAVKYPCGAAESDGKTTIGKKLVKTYGGKCPEMTFPFYSSGSANYAVVGDYLVGYCILGKWKVSVYYKKV